MQILKKIFFNANITLWTCRRPWAMFVVRLFICLAWPVANRSAGRSGRRSDATSVVWTFGSVGSWPSALQCLACTGVERNAAAADCAAPTNQLANHQPTLFRSALPLPQPLAFLLDFMAAPT